MNTNDLYLSLLLPLIGPVRNEKELACRYIHFEKSNTVDTYVKNIERLEGSPCVLNMEASVAWIVWLWTLR